MASAGDKAIQFQWRVVPDCSSSFLAVLALAIHNKMAYTSSYCKCILG